MEPLIMAILGVLVGGMVIAMYLPIFKLGPADLVDLQGCADERSV